MSLSVDRRNLLAGAAATIGAGALGACASTSATAEAAASQPSDALGADDATAVATRIRAGEITPAEALDAAIARIEALNPMLNFMAAKTYDRARAAVPAKASGPFAGVPTLIKDSMALAEAPLSYGSRAFARNVAHAQTPYVDALIAAGLTPLGKSTLPEFGLAPTTEPLLFGATRNPWDPTRSSGGSSGGAASAVASGAVPIAQASDGGGSIRIPAACCGLVGLKVTRGRNIVTEPDNGPIALSVPGCVSRSVRDTALWLAVAEQSGANAALAPVGLVSAAGSRRLRIGMQIASAMGDEPDPAVRAAVEETAELCRALGHEVFETSLPFDGSAFAAAFLALWSAMAAQIARDVGANAQGAPIDQLLEPLTLGFASAYARAPQGSVEAAVHTLRAVEAQYSGLFADYDLLLTPTLPTPAAPIGHLAPTVDFDTVVARMSAYAAYTPLQNVAGAPAITLPLAVSETGLPIGVQFSAAGGQERILLELAYELESARPWSGRRPAVWAG